ncbi:universal stress protein, partial [Streptomyces nodosus]|uniref:universal stress protein n=1 Tax=Streptomyces nodosus TaxID=40318 RepID=UPI0034561306
VLGKVSDRTFLMHLGGKIEMAHPDVRVRRATAEGAARTVLLRRSAAADLVVIGTLRRHSHFGLQLGRVAHTLLHHAHCPVAIVPRRV